MAGRSTKSGTVVELLAGAVPALPREPGGRARQEAIHGAGVRGLPAHALAEKLVDQARDADVAMRRFDARPPSRLFVESDRHVLHGTRLSWNTGSVSTRGNRNAPTRE